VKKVVASVGDADVQPRDDCLLLLPIAGELLLVAQATLGGAHLLLEPAKAIYRLNKLAGRQGRKLRHPHVDADLGRAWMNRICYLTLRLYRYEPVSPSAFDGDVLERPFDLSALAETHPTEPWELDTMAFNLDVALIDGQAKTVVAAPLFLEARKASVAPEEVAEGTDKVLENLLLGLAVDLREKA